MYTNIIAWPTYIYILYNIIIIITLTIINVIRISPPFCVFSLPPPPISQGGGEVAVFFLSARKNFEEEQSSSRGWCEDWCRLEMRRNLIQRRVRRKRERDGTIGKRKTNLSRLS